MGRNRILSGRLMGVVAALSLVLRLVDDAYAGRNENIFLLYAGSADSHVQQGILIREITKQGLLMAVQERLGLKPWDVVLNGTNIPQGCTTYHVDTLVSSNFDVNIMLWAENGGISNVAWSTAFNSGKDEHFDYAFFLKKISSLSRTEVVEALRKDGVKGEPVKWNAQAALSDSARNALMKMDFIQQWAALCELDKVTRENGESLQTLAGSARGYANQAQLTAFFWNAMDKAFMARALLSAERLVAADNESAWALSHRAYARTMAGLHGLALDDMEAVRNKHAGQANGNDPLPDWLDVLDAYCRYDHGKLLEIVTDKPADELAQFLYALEMQHYGCDTVKIEEIRNVLTKIPNCFRVHDILCDVCGVSNGHLSTTFGPAIFAKSLYQELGCIAGLPADLKLLAGKRTGVSNASEGDENPLRCGRDGAGFSDADSRANVVKILFEYAAKAGDDPSWAMLGNMIWSTTFVHVQRRVDFMKKMWGVPVDQFLKTVNPYLADHPYRSYIESHGLDPQRDRKEYRGLLSNIVVVDAKPNMIPMMNATWQLGGASNFLGTAAFVSAFSHSDAIAGDLESGITTFCIENKYSCGTLGRNKELMQRTRLLKQVSPYSPVTVASLIVNDWDNSKAEVPTWEKGYLNSPLVLKAFANRYVALKDYTKAERFLRICVGKYPEEWAYSSLADVYKRQNKIDLWLGVLEESLSRPDYGLGHASVRVEIANYFMEKGEWKKAEPYAREAAQTWACWAMMCASRCYEGMEDWKTSEMWIQRISERYDNSRVDWYLWCKRTGHGDVAAAFNALSGDLRRMESSQGEEEKSRAAVINFLNGDKAKAFLLFQENFRRSYDPYVGLHAILLARDLKDDAAYGKLLNEMHEKGRIDKNRGTACPFYLELLTAYEAMNKDSSEANFDIAVDACLKNVAGMKNAGMAKGCRANVLYFAGRMSEIAGKKELAKKCFTRCLETRCKDLWTYTLASISLRM